ncbi:MAG: hypothetical protein J5772_06360 [Clostridia bacterium]|nr:hypothetical protein [Clostridia bacterium]
MNELDFLQDINDLEPEALNVSAPVKVKSWRGAKRWLAIAAAAIVVCGCVTAGAVALHRGSFGPIKEGTHGYTAEFELEKYKWKEFTGEITEAPELIVEQYATFTPPPIYSNKAFLPNMYFKDFGTLTEAVDYIGLDTMKDVSLPFSEDVTVSVTGDKKGRIKEIDVSSQHYLWDDPMRFGAFFNVKILTQYSSSSVMLSGGDWGDYDPGSIEYKEFLTSKGVLCQYAEIGIGDDSRRQMVSGYIVDSGILYNLGISFDDGGLDTALGMLMAWAEEF